MKYHGQLHIWKDHIYINFLQHKIWVEIYKSMLASLTRNNKWLSGIKCIYLMPVNYGEIGFLLVYKFITNHSMCF
jgi:hypothetical protein